MNLQSINFMSPHSFKDIMHFNVNCTERQKSTNQHMYKGAAVERHRWYLTWYFMYTTWCFKITRCISTNNCTQNFSKKKREKKKKLERRKIQNFHDIVLVTYLIMVQHPIQTRIPIP